MSLKILIIDNDNGEVLVDEANANGCLIAISTEEKTKSSAFVRCNAFDIAQMIYSCEKTISHARKRDPKVILAEKFIAVGMELYESSGSDEGEES